MTLSAAGLLEGSSPGFEGSALLDLGQFREQLIHLPIANKFLFGLELANPVAEEPNRFFIHHGSDEWRHLTATTTEDALIENGTSGVTRKDEHGIVNPKGVVLGSGAEKIHSGAGGGEAQFDFRIASSGFHVADRAIGVQIRASAFFERMSRV